MAEERWYTLKEIAALTGRKANSIRHHLVEEWSLDGMAKKIDGVWMCSEDALSDVRDRLWQRDEAENKRLMAEEGQGRDVVAASTRTDFGDDYFFKAQQVLGKLTAAIIQLPDSQADALGRQTIHVSPHAKSIRIVIPGGTTKAILFDIEPPGGKPN